MIHYGWTRVAVVAAAVASSGPRKSIRHVAPMLSNAEKTRAQFKFPDLF
jgi:hypothetical protein